MAPSAEDPGALTPRALAPLALALAATACAELGGADDAALRPAFGAALVALDDADAAYNRAIDEILPPPDAAAMRAAIARFRDQSAAIRERVRVEIGELYRRSGRAYGAFDPLDSYLPPTMGLSHADATRVATRSDAARSEVDALRARANAELMQRTDAAALEALIAAKRERRTRFGAALATALAPHAPDARERTKVVEHLTLLAEGWY